MYVRGTSLHLDMHIFVVNTLLFMRFVTRNETFYKYHCKHLFRKGKTIKISKLKNIQIILKMQTKDAKDLDI